MAKKLAEKTRNWAEPKRPTGLMDDLEHDDLYIESNPNSYEPTSYVSNTPVGVTNYLDGGDGEISMLRRQISVVLCAASIFFEGINLSLAGPFFPDQAIKKGLTQIQIGWVTASPDISSLVSAFVIASLVSPNNLKFFNLIGMLWVSVSIALFGWSASCKDAQTFFIICLACRSVNGVGTSLIQNTVVPLTARMFPDKSSTVTAIIHFSFGLGLLAGPLLGSVVLPILGYEAPFIMTGVAEGITCICAFIFVPSKVNNPLVTPPKTKISNTDFIRFFIKPRVLLFIIPEMMLFSTMGFRDSSFSTYMQQNLGVSKDNTGYAFLPFSGAYVLAAPVFGFLVRHGFGIFLLIAGQIFVAVALFCFYLPDLADSLEDLTFVLPMLFIFGVCVSSIFNPHYLLVEQIALREGFKNPGEIKTLGASCYNLMAASSRAMGAFVFGGYLNDEYQFYNTCLIYSCILAVMAAWQIAYLYFEGYIRRIYYQVLGYTDFNESVKEASNQFELGESFATSAGSVFKSSRAGSAISRKSRAESIFSSVYKSYDQMPAF